MSKQKFFRGQRVKLDDVMPEFMSHFPAGGEAIVDHSYTDIYYGDEFQNQSLALVLLDPVKEFRGWTAWYHESQLTLLSDDRVAGEKILQRYKVWRKETADEKV